MVENRALVVRWVLGGILILIVTVVALVLIGRADRGADAPGAAGSSSAAAVQEEPLQVQQSAELTVPDTIQMGSRTFEAEAGRTYLLEFTAATSKPEGSPGAAMYFGANLACGSREGGTLRSVGGTQNARTGEQIAIRNQFLLEVEESGAYSCRVQVFSPNPNVDARGTTADVLTQWSATRIDGAAHEVSGDPLLPRLVAPEERAAAFEFKVDLEPGAVSHLDLLGTVHVTTCTEVEGSSEDGRTWCRESEIDADGSNATFTYRADVLDEAGETCDSRIIDVSHAHIDRRTHHRIFNLARSVAQPVTRCGQTLRIVVEVENRGPAPLLVHRASSNLVVISNS